jgi:hypothetical protein
MRTIRVTGTGTLMLKPDMTRITLDLGDVCPEYDEAMRRSSEHTHALRELLSDLGFQPSDLKTLSFSVDAEYESYRDFDDTYKQRFVGYRFLHRMKLEFESDNDRLGRVLYALAHSAAQPEFRVSAFVRDTESAKNALLEKAAADSAKKAALLARAAGAELKAVQSIDYSWGELRFESETVNCCVDSEAVCLSKIAPTDRYALDVEPDDIRATETVTMVWELG